MQKKKKKSQYFVFFIQLQPDEWTSKWKEADPKKNKKKQFVFWKLLFLVFTANVGSAPASKSLS